MLHCTCSLGGRSDVTEVAEVKRFCVRGGFNDVSASTDRWGGLVMSIYERNKYSQILNTYSDVL